MSRNQLHLKQKLYPYQTLKESFCQIRLNISFLESKFVVTYGILIDY